MIDRQNPATPEPGAPPDSWSAESVSGAPMPRAPEGAREHHPELYAAWVKGIEAGYLNNQQVFQRAMLAFTDHRGTRQHDGQQRYLIDDANHTGEPG